MKKIILLTLLAICTQILTAQSTLNRLNDPVVMTGAQLPGYAALNPTDIIGFQFLGGMWTQIPIQVDERALLDIVTPYGALAGSGNIPQPLPNNLQVLYYCDPMTNVGADADATFDADDELVFMIKDAGDESDGSFPVGVISGTCRQVIVEDPLGGLGYVYLFENDGTLAQDAGVTYINYSSDVTSVAGFPAHLDGFNAESTTINTSAYSWHFSGEWISDEFSIALGTNVDILDRYKNFFADGFCGRTEDSFSDAENAYIANIAGPIRVIRSYMGANSGPLTQRTHLFYEARHDIFTDLRVHDIPSIYDVFDYTSAANGMIYTNELNTGGVTIDGANDAVNPGDIEWEQLTGAQGTVSILLRKNTDIVSPTDGTFIGYYDDDVNSPGNNCTGDADAWGTSGLGIIFGNICTDPIGGGCGAGSSDYRVMQARRTIYADAANSPTSTASNYNLQMNNPLNIAVAACCAPLDLTINFDSTPAQTSWELFDADGNPVFSSDSYAGEAGNSTVTESSCLPDGCYDLVFNDSANNGLCPFQSNATSAATFITPGTLITPGSVVATLGSVVTPGLCGNYTLYDANGAVLASGGGGFGASQTNTFCLSGGLMQFAANEEGMYLKATNISQMRIIPNIVKNETTLHYSLETQNDIHIKIIDITGKIVQQYTRDFNDFTTFNLNVSDLQSGFYFVQLISGNVVMTEKFVKR